MNSNPCKFSSSASHCAGAVKSLRVVLKRSLNTITFRPSDLLCPGLWLAPSGGGGSGGGGGGGSLAAAVLGLAARGLLKLSANTDDCRQSAETALVKTGRRRSMRSIDDRRARREAGLMCLKPGPHRTRQRCSGPVCDHPSASRPVPSRQNRLQRLEAVCTFFLRSHVRRIRHRCRKDTCQSHVTWNVAWITRL